ncbi:MAG TPA: hypothetical protein VGG64_28965 [Pirellulales bacterium]
MEQNGFLSTTNLTAPGVSMAKGKTTRKSSKKVAKKKSKNDKPKVWSADIEVLAAQFNALVQNKMESMTSTLDKAIADGNWEAYVFMHPRTDRLRAFLDLPMEDAPDEDFWRLLGKIWIDSEFLWQEMKLWKSFLSATRSMRHHIMEKDDRKAFEKLPDVLTIYRGGEHNGLSWTVDKAKAKWFAKRLCFGTNKPVVRTGTCQKKDVIAYFNGRNEKEIVILPSNIKGKKLL